MEPNEFLHIDINRFCTWTFFIGRRVLLFNKNIQPTVLDSIGYCAINPKKSYSKYKPSFLATFPNDPTLCNVKETLQTKTI